MARSSPKPDTHGSRNDLMPAPDDALIKRDLRDVSPISALDGRSSAHLQGRCGYRKTQPNCADSHLSAFGHADLTCDRCWLTIVLRKDRQSGAQLVTAA